MLTREEKEKVVAEMREKFGRAKGIVVTHYKGMTVAEITDLRDTLRKQSIEYHVVKNTLARIAAEGTPMASAREAFSGPVGVAVEFEDAARLAKAVLGFAKKNEKLVVKGGVVDGTYYDPKQLDAISKLPSREVMLGIMAGTLQAPATKMAQLLAATVARFGFAMTALRDKREAA
jgi:large subunit ribosomal protein L10